MTGDRRVTAIVLAGGRSSRFGRDKLAEPVAGRTLLQHAIEGVRAFATDVLVVAAPAASPDVPAGIRVVHDPRPFEGPLAGLRAGLTSADTDVVLVTAGDMPDLAPAVAEALLAALDAPETEAVLLRHDGRSRPLPMALRRQPALAAAAALVAAGERRLGALPEALRHQVIEEADWRPLDPDGRTLEDVDTPEDLRQPNTPQAHEDPRRRNGGSASPGGRRRG
jgi:molybdopterin-guanine dinucleotide biosynthesis protein A